MDDVNRLNGEVDEYNNKTTISISIPYADVSYFDNPDTPDNVFNTTDISIMQHRQYSTAVYDLSGRKVAESTEGLNAGIYIVGGKKIVVKNTHVFLSHCIFFCSYVWQFQKNNVTLRSD